MENKDMVHARILDAAVSIMDAFADSDGSAASCMGPSIYYYAVVPMLGQYLSLMQNPGTGKILPGFQALLSELGEDQFVQLLLQTLNQAPWLVPQEFNNAKSDLGGIMEEVLLHAWLLKVEPEEAKAEGPDLYTGVAVALNGRKSSKSTIGPRSAKEQSFFPRAFCTALAIEALAPSGTLPGYIKFTGGRATWRQGLIDSLASTK
jgi:hypothetical protein